MPAQYGIDYTLNPAFDPATQRRFKITVRGHDPEDTQDDGYWTHKLDFTDNKYLDCDGYPLYAIASGASWAAAFETAGKFLRSALDSPTRPVFI
jgi:hypothetical protein